MKSFDIMCQCGGAMQPVTISVGHPKKGNHPLQNQSAFLSSERGAVIPQETMDAFLKLLDLAEEKGVSFEELCDFAVNQSQEN